jgi:glutamine synthetase
MTIGVDTLPKLPLDNSDRNRTSPFAFTGNKFEFRMVPSSMSIADANMVLNTIVAESLDEIATRLEKAKDLEKEVTAIVRETMKEHGRVIFNGNNYSDDWVKEAAKRGLPNISSACRSLRRLGERQHRGSVRKVQSSYGPGSFIPDTRLPWNNMPSTSTSKLAVRCR